MFLYKENMYYYYFCSVIINLIFVKKDSCVSLKVIALNLSKRTTLSQPPSDVHSVQNEAKWTLKQRIVLVGIFFKSVSGSYTDSVVHVKKIDMERKLFDYNNDNIHSRVDDKFYFEMRNGYVHFIYILDKNGGMFCRE